MRVNPAAAYKTSPVKRGAGIPQATDAARKPFRRFISKLSRLVLPGSTDTLFDGKDCCGGMGILPLGDPGNAGVRLDPAPAQPGETEVPRMTWNQVHMPGAKPTGLRRLFTRSSVKAYELPGDPQDAASVETALRRLIASDPARFGGLRPDALKTIISQKVLILVHSTQIHRHPDRILAKDMMLDFMKNQIQKSRLNFRRDT